ncbi:MAG: 7-cyano-7-deazaguanine synthase [Thermoplasmatota archaeon]
MNSKKVKIVALLSDGIDSAVAVHLLAEVGAEISLLYLDRFGKEGSLETKKRSFEKVRSIVRKLEQVHGKLELYRGEYAPIMEDFTAKIDNRYTCLLCRRMMYRTAEKLAKEIGADAITTGESLGQVASQTLDNITNEDDAVKMPILRPLVGLDKNEVISIAREIGTYEVSISESFDCPYTPSSPAISSDHEKIIEDESRFDIDRLLKRIDLEHETHRR